MTKKAITKKEFKLPWRPEKYNEETINKLSSVFQMDWTVSEACSYAKISRETYYTWIKKKEWFSDRMSEAKDFLFTIARKKLTKDIQNPNTDARSAIEFLKRRDKRYQDKWELQVEVEIENPLEKRLKELWLS